MLFSNGKNNLWLVKTALLKCYQIDFGMQLLALNNKLILH